MFIEYLNSTEYILFGVNSDKNNLFNLVSDWCEESSEDEYILERICLPLKCKEILNWNGQRISANFNLVNHTM